MILSNLFMEYSPRCESYLDESTFDGLDSNMASSEVLSLWTAPPFSNTDIEAPPADQILTWHAGGVLLA